MMDELVKVLHPLIKQFMPFAQERMGFDKPPRLFLRHDTANSQNPFGKTAHYDPGAQSVSIYVTGRHPKDILRSLSHELVHHSQCCRGEFENAAPTTPGYAQQDDHMREMEREAYEKGNIVPMCSDCNNWGQAKDCDFELKDNLVSIRRRFKGDLGKMDLNSFIERLQLEINNKGV